MNFKSIISKGNIGKVLIIAVGISFAPYVGRVINSFMSKLPKMGG